MRFLIPQGIGDSVWALLKVQDIASKLGDGIVDLSVCVLDNKNVVETRAFEFLRRFSFVRNVEAIPVHSVLPGPATTPEGYLRYMPDGRPDHEDKRLSSIDYVLMPNAPLERGIRIENWLPEFKTRWDIVNDFSFYPQEEHVASNIKNDVGDYCVLYLGPEVGNTSNGHNRNSLWRPEDWAYLGYRINEMNLSIVLVGASYDLSYWVNRVSPCVAGGGWLDLIGATDIGTTYAITKKAKFVVSYQSGIGIFSSYLGTPTAIFWRPRGDSISPDFYISFEEEMASAWTNPKMVDEGKHLPLIYGRHNPDYVFSEIVRRGWC